MGRSLNRIALVVTVGALLSKVGGLVRQLVITAANVCQAHCPGRSACPSRSHPSGVDVVYGQHGSSGGNVRSSWNPNRCFGVRARGL